MKYYSLKNESVIVTFGEALLAGLAPDGGLWMPRGLPQFTPRETARLGAMCFADCAACLARFFVDTPFTDADLKRICHDAYDYPVPMRTFDGYHLDSATPEVAGAFVLELFHGPTLAFKDFAARFMARSASRLMQNSDETRTILVATSGDTGGAIGEAFLNQAGIEVYILFPQGGVSKVQRQQLTTIGNGLSNVHALSVAGTFDDCQQMVKDAFADDRLMKKHKLMSANSINVGRVVPQSFYYFWTSLQAKAAYVERDIVYAVPSGNLGNLTGGLMAWKMGAPIDHFVIGNNINDPFVEYLNTGKYRPRDAVPTLSNAMDIGRPNNFPRIMELFDGNFEALKKVCWGASFPDEETERHLRRIHTETGYVMCPHTAVGHLAMEAFKAEFGETFTGITVGTAHPAKFADRVEPILGQDIPMPNTLKNTVDRTPCFVEIAPDLDDLAEILAS